MSMIGMEWDDPEFFEAIRLIRKFFPESRGYISSTQGIDWCHFLMAMEAAEFYHDCSCDPFWVDHADLSIPEVSLAMKGAIDGEESDIYARLIEHAGFSPQGRVVVVPDALGAGGGSIEDRRPFVCASRTLPIRLEEYQGKKSPQGYPARPVFDGSSDSIFVYESGEAMLLQHDLRFFWARSRNASNRPSEQGADDQLPARAETKAK